MAEIEKKIRVCVIGAGAAGLCAIRHLSHDLTTFQPTAFEQSSSVGGTWVYDEKTGLDDSGYPIHSSMYKNLRTNIPLKLMNFPDFTRMDQSKPSCGGHSQVLEYLREYCEHFQLSPFIQFRTRIECVKPLKTEEKTTWTVRIKNTELNTTEEQSFDAVIVCNGHYAEPKVPLITGVETFQGEAIHSHDYRSPEKYLGKTVIILGAGPSGIDIAIELTNSATHVYLSHNIQRLTSVLPTNLSQVAGIDSISGREFRLKDASVVEADVLIYCTGYHYSFPFLDEDCRIRVSGNHVTKLFKQLVNVEYPTMSIVGIPSRVIPFPLFHFQVQYFLAFLKGNFTLPSKENMLTESENVDSMHPHVLGESQWDYNDSLADTARIPRLNTIYKNGYTLWTMKRVLDLVRYKDSEIRVENDGQTVDIIL